MKQTLRHRENWTGHRDPVIRPALLLLTVCAIAGIILLTTGCTLTISPDGTRTYATQPENILRAARVLAEK